MSSQEETRVLGGLDRILFVHGVLARRYRMSSVRVVKPLGVPYRDSHHEPGFWQLKKSSKVSSEGNDALSDPEPAKVRVEVRGELWQSSQQFIWGKECTGRGPSRSKRLSSRRKEGDNLSNLGFTAPARNLISHIQPQFLASGLEQRMSEHRADLKLQPKRGEETDRRDAGELVTTYPRYNARPALIDVSPSKHPRSGIEEIPFLPIKHKARRYFQCR